ncbi:nucleotidyltransferase family protein [Candidatus Woesearchaeota archaeon]|nr:nucleotidyltransferase family protein [Candidatus Woesearchaeota archaeon]
MKAIILAAGYATRLYPLTENKAKPLLEVQGKPIIEYIVEKIEHCPEIDEIYIVTNEKFYMHFCEWLKTKKFKRRIHVINDKTTENGARLGAIGDIDYVIGTQHVFDDFLVIAGDNMFSFQIAELIQFYKKYETTVVALYDTKDKKKIAGRLGCIELDKTNRVKGFEEKPENPKTTLAATACYLFPQEDLHFIREALEEKHFDRPGDLIKFIAEKKPVYGFQFSGYWFDVGTHEEYALVNSKKVKL